MSKYVDIEIEFLEETDAALYCTTDPEGDYEEDVFIPFSVIEDPSAFEQEKLGVHGDCTISVARWFLRKKNIPYDSDSG